MDMIDLVVTVCAVLSPNMCEEKHLVFSASFSLQPTSRPPAIAPRIESKPPMISTGSALSTINESENWTPSRAPQSNPATSLTAPAVAQTGTRQ